ncbi:MAG: DNA-processing protein DprA [Microbacteriaceae bacterium]
MTIFGLAQGEVTSLVSSVVGRELDRDAVELHFAHASWSGIAEPGDRLAGIAVEKLGAVVALQMLIDKREPQWFRAALGEEHAASVSLEDAEKAIARWMPRLDSHVSLLAVRQASRFGARLLIPSDPHWPSALADLGDHGPIALWQRGSDEAVAALSRSIALVGARAATGYGEHITMEASAGLVDRGYAIVSGAAYGIDGMAHRAALASKGITVAFLAGGVDRFYPSGHDALLTRIVETGAVLSELPCGASPTKWRFLQRNRLIAAAGLATIVLEAGWRSGSLNTAGHALSLGRPLGAVPGPVTSAASAGCHKLLRESEAVCVTTPDEMAQLAPLPGATFSDGAPRSGANHTAVRVLDALSTRSPRRAADVAARSGLSVANTQSALGLLELDGAVEERERGWLSKQR